MSELREAFEAEYMRVQAQCCVALLSIGTPSKFWCGDRYNNAEIQTAFDMFKAQQAEVPEGTTQYYWPESEFCTTDPVSDYDMDLGDDEVLEIYCWVKIDKPHVYFANIYSKDERTVTMFNSLEAAEEAVAANAELRKAFYGEAQENDRG